jgi:beta-lactamase regulating signal transducer with metallopeptidase domain
MQLSHFLVGLGRLSAQGAILVLLVVAAQWAFRKHLSPRWRCALWLLVAARLLMPISLSSITSVFNLLPDWPHARAATPTHETASVSVAASPVVITPLPLRNVPVASIPPLPTRITQTSSPSWPVWIFAVWLAGVILLAGQVLFSSLRFWKRCAKLQRLTHSATIAALDDCCRQLKVRTRPMLLESSEIKSPALHGLFRPRLLLPKGFIDQFSRAELRFVFLHELAHLKRRDLLANWVMAALQIIHWFNPLVWFGFGRWRADREVACDAIALEAAGQEQSKLYGLTILRLLENFSRPVSTPGLVGILEDKRQLHLRIHMIANYAPSGKWPVLALLLATGLAAIGLTDARNQTLVAKESPSKSPSVTHANLDSHDSAPDPAGHTGYSLTNLSTFKPGGPWAAGYLVALEESAPAAPAKSDIASQLIGAWVLVGTPDKVHPVPAEGGRMKFYTGKYYCITQCDPAHGDVVVFHHGGTYTINGNETAETVQYANPTTMNYIGKTMGHFKLSIDGDTLTQIGTDNEFKEVWKRRTPAAGSPSGMAKDMTGAWIRVDGPDDAGNVPAPGATIKFITPTDWCFTESDAKTGIVTFHHGGTCTFNGDEYVESVKYANPSSMYMIGQNNKFTSRLDGDTLTTTGIGNPWNEVWKRAK